MVICNDRMVLTFYEPVDGNIRVSGEKEDGSRWIVTLAEDKAVILRDTLLNRENWYVTDLTA